MDYVEVSMDYVERALIWYVDTLTMLFLYLELLRFEEGMGPFRSMRSIGICIRNSVVIVAKPMWFLLQIAHFVLESRNYFLTPL